jgi:triacylglycerol lipase
MPANSSGLPPATASAGGRSWAASRGGPDIPAYAAAARAESLKGLPATYISTAALDIFCDENLDYAKRLVAAGVPTELHLYPGAYHGYEIAFDAEVTRRSAADALHALRRALV